MIFEFISSLVALIVILLALGVMLLIASPIFMIAIALAPVILIVAGISSLPGGIVLIIIGLYLWPKMYGSDEDNPAEGKTVHDEPRRVLRE